MPGPAAPPASVGAGGCGAQVPARDSVFALGGDQGPPVGHARGGAAHASSWGEGRGREPGCCFVGFWKAAFVPVSPRMSPLGVLSPGCF